jgi:hypothetical protein
VAFGRHVSPPVTVAQKNGEWTAFKKERVLYVRYTPIEHLLRHFDGYFVILI